MSFFDDAPSVRIAVLGLGYVGLPLAVAFGHHPTAGFDVNPQRVGELKDAFDRTLQICRDELASLAVVFSSDAEDLNSCSLSIVAVPTPLDHHKQSDLRAAIPVSRMAGETLSKGDLVIVDSTVYPGATEEDCVTTLQVASNPKLNEDFFVGYSPERANPVDREHRLGTITKVTAGPTPQAPDLVVCLYNLIVTAGARKAPSIRVAEAAKIIENTQRDLSMAPVNELALVTWLIVSASFILALPAHIAKPLEVDSLWLPAAWIVAFLVYGLFTRLSWKRAWLESRDLPKYKTGQRAGVQEPEPLRRTLARMPDTAT